MSLDLDSGRLSSGAVHRVSTAGIRNVHFKAFKMAKDLPRVRQSGGSQGRTQNTRAQVGVVWGPMKRLRSFDHVSH